jgi:FkbH-like protein
MLKRGRSNRPARRVLAIAAIFAPIVVSAAILAGMIYVVDWLLAPRWYVWLTLSPLLYIAWLTIFLILCVSSTRRLGRHPKPRRAVVPLGGDAKEIDPGAATVVLCMFRATFIPMLPLVSGLSQINGFRKLLLRSYSPSIHVGEGTLIWGLIMDPDLTYIGDRAVIGWNTEVSAHVLTRRPDGSFAYLSAPIKIGAGVTIGGSSRIGLGCVLGEGAVVEPMSFVEPFTIIAPGETWGGNPARCLRKREEALAPERVTQPRRVESSSVELEQASKLVAFALGIRPAEMPADLSADTCAAWDSVGQVGIATALFDAYGVTVGNDRLFQLRTLNDVANAIAGRMGAANTSPAQTPAPAAPAAAARSFAVELEPARRLVAFALGLPASEMPAELSADTCAAWDSVGQVAIATALFDSYGVTVGNDRLFRLRTLDDVADAIAKRSSAPSATDSLPGDLELLPLTDPTEATRALTGRFLDQPAAAPPLRVVIAASSTAQPLATTMKVWGRAFGLELDCEFAGFSRVAQTLLDGDGPFATNAAGVNVVLVDPSDRMFDSAEQASHGLEELLEALEAWRTRQPTAAQTLVGTLPPLVSAFATLDRRQYEQLRHQWRTRVEAMPGFEVFDFAAVVEQVGVAAARSSEGEVFSRMPYSPALYQALGIAVVRQILARRRSPAKVIAVDCDDTLWGGVLGEVGLDGIKLGSDGAGRGFQLFQRRLKQLKERGLLLVVVSKNEEDDVLRVFQNHPEMILRADDIAAWRVNWKHKSENLQELAEELNLGIDSFVFLDDDAAVRTEVSMRLPGVHVIPLPEDSARYCETLERLWLFDGAQATEADQKRTRMMQEESQRQRTRKTAVSLDDYLASLELEVDIREPDQTEWARVAQLTQRTNQFNLSLKRRTLEEVKALAVSYSVRILKARDRFGDYGLVGACVFHKAESAACEVDTLLMSCRVLGRGVEDAFLHAVAAAAAAQGATRLVAPFVAGPRNQLAKDFLVRTGFQETQPNTWVLPLAEAPALPKHVRWIGAPALVAEPHGN